MDWHFIKHNIFPTIAALSDVLTSIISIAVIYAYIKNRNKVISLYHIFINRLKSERLKKLNLILDEFDRLNYENKEDRIEIMNTFGKLVGHIKTNPLLVEKCAVVQIEIERILSKSRKLNGPTKERIAKEIRGHMENTQDEIDKDIARNEK